MPVAQPAAITRGKDGQLLEPLDITAHKEVIRRMKEEQDANLEMRLKLCNPKFAAEAESRKPVFKWRVEFRTIHRAAADTTPKDKYADNGDDEGDEQPFKFRQVVKTVTAQDEADAWAKACDLLGEWPSPKIAKPRFKKLSQIKL